MTHTSDYIRILGIDPGGTTGISTFYCDVNEPLTAEWGLTQLPPDAAADYIAGYVAECAQLRSSFEALGAGTAHVVIERFVPSARALTFQPDALELIGYTRHLCRQHQVPFSLQAPADAKKIAPNELLRSLGAYRRNTPHGWDAARHVVLHLHKTYPAFLRTLRGKADG